jgi:hypothetical protein
MIQKLYKLIPNDDHEVSSESVELMIKNPSKSNKRELKRDRILEEEKEPGFSK